MRELRVIVCERCGYVYEAGRAVYPEDLPLCSTCERLGFQAAECSRCKEYDVVDSDGVCFECAFEQERHA